MSENIKVFLGIDKSSTRDYFIESEGLILAIYTKRLVEMKIYRWNPIKVIF